MELNVTFLIQLLAFLFTVVMVSRVAFGPILHTLDEREKRTAGARAQAAALAGASGQDAGLIEKRIQDARLSGLEEMASLKAAGEKAEGALAASAKEEAGRALEQARVALRAGAEKARADLKNQAQQLAVSIADKALGRTA